MKFTSKLCVAAVAAALAGPAAAAIDNGQGVPAGHTANNGELLLSVWDSVGARSYTRDLGVYLDDFLPTGSATSAGFTMTWGPDAVWASFVAGLDAQRIGSFKYDVIAIDGIATPPQRARFITTTNTVLTSANAPFNSSITQATGSAMGYINALNNLGAAQNPGQAGAGQQFDAVNVAADNALIAESSDGDAYFGDNGKGEQWGGQATTFVTTATVGNSLNVYLVSQSSSVTVARAAVDKFDNLYGDATFRLDGNGALTYMAPVPEPGTYALMLSGLLAVAAWARRKGKR